MPSAAAPAASRRDERASGCAGSGYGALRQRSPDPSGPDPAMRALRSGVTEVANAVTGEGLEMIAPDAGHRELVRRLGLCSYVSAPLLARGRPLGVVSLVGTEPGRWYGTAEVALAEELARLAAQAVESAALYREAHGRDPLCLDPRGARARTRRV